MSELSDMQLRVRALETILTEKGYVDPAALDQIVENVETKSARISGRASSRAPGSTPSSSAGCSKTRPRRSTRSPGSTRSPLT